VFASCPNELKNSNCGTDIEKMFSVVINQIQNTSANTHIDSIYKKYIMQKRRSGIDETKKKEDVPYRKTKRGCRGGSKVKKPKKHRVDSTVLSHHNISTTQNFEDYNSRLPQSRILSRYLMNENYTVSMTKQGLNSQDNNNENSKDNFNSTSSLSHNNQSSSPYKEESLSSKRVSSLLFCSNSR
jgi:hypothetical protein